MAQQPGEAVETELAGLGTRAGAGRRGPFLSCRGQRHSEADSLTISLISYSAVDFVIGLLITLGASLINALGLNITKLDFNRQEALPPASRRPDWQRPFWLLGLILYIASQVIGSTLALEFLRAEYVAPLGSTSLIFNVIL